MCRKPLAISAAMCCQPLASSPQPLPHHFCFSSTNLMPHGQTATDGEEADAQGEAGSPSLDLPMVSWSETPRDLLECILEKLEEHRDVLLFSSVCAAWQSFTFENLQRFPRQLPLSRCQCQLPLLMLPSKDASCDFLCVFEQKSYGGMPLPGSNKWIWGSSNGWLLTVDITGSEISLLNPISRDQINLPCKSEIPRPKCDKYQVGLQTFQYLRKGAMSKSPASNIAECAVMAIISTTRVLSFCRAGDSKWTSVPDSPVQVDDIIYYREQFYAVNSDGVVLTCDIGPSPKTTAVVGGPKVYDDPEVSEDMIYGKRYLVEDRGELLQVVRIVCAYWDETNDEILEHRTVDFQVFKLHEKGLEVDENEEDGEKGPEDNKDEEVDEYENIDGKFVPVEDSSYKWIKLDNLHNRIVFLGYNQSILLPTGALPNSRGNCIYFTDDNLDYHYGRLIDDIPESCDDLGVFNLEDGCINTFHTKDLVLPMPPIWVSPAPW